MRHCDLSNTGKTVLSFVTENSERTESENFTDKVLALRNLSQKNKVF